MRERTFYRWSLLVPMLVPLPLLPVVRSGTHGPFGALAAILVFGAAYAGVPYLVLAAALLSWMRGRTGREIRRALVLMPILLLPLFVAFLAAVALASNWGGEGSAAAETIARLSLHLLAVGYGYVAAGLLALALLKSAGLVRAE